jgi:hypothetical protein
LIKKMLRFDVQHVNKSLSLATNFRNHNMLRFDQENVVSISSMELLRLSFIFKDAFLSLLFFAGAYETTRIHLSILENALWGTTRTLFMSSLKDIIPWVSRESFYTGKKKHFWGNYTRFEGTTRALFMSSP